MHKWNWRLYEVNYDCLMLLIPEFPELNEGTAYRWKMAEDQELFLTIIERQKYTSTIALTYLISAPEQYLSNPYFKVRIYHDAKQVEVISYLGESRFKPIYPYPNPKMYQPNEKRQINLFFRDMLDHWLRQGHLFKIYTPV